jgi:SAM-dependent methyltransferase
MNEKIEIKQCRGCGSTKLTPILSLGEQYVTNFIEKAEEQGQKIPLEIVLCENCKLLQLKHNAPPETMWADQYWYKSGISSTIKNDLKDIVEKATYLKNLNKEDLVIDIGCNDGTLLSFYEHPKENLIGFEPSKNVAKESMEKGFNIINNFFNSQNFKEKFGNRKAKIITAISMFYDLEDPNSFLKDITEILDKDGLFIIQQNYLLSMLEENAFDNICHEHREYYSFISLKNILKKYNLEIFDVSLNEINGGSIRTYIKFADNSSLNGFEEAKKRIKEIEQREKDIGLETLKPYTDFANRISSIKQELTSFLKEKKAEGKKIWIYGASTRGNVILQYFNLTPELVDFIADKNSDKWGKKTIGSMIPIVRPEEIIKENPNYLLVNVWHFFKEVKEQEKEWFNQGGIFLVPLPSFKIVKE